MRPMGERRFTEAGLDKVSHFLSLPSKRAAIIRPMPTAMVMAATARAMPRFRPKTLAVRTIVRRFMAGPEKRKTEAGPMPAPLLDIPADMGKIVQLHTASIVPDVAATE